MSFAALLTVAFLASTAPLTSSNVLIDQRVVTLEAPSTWWELSPDQRARFGSGCGPMVTHIRAGNVLGVDLNEACNIHDFMYTVGGTEKDRLLADKVLWSNFYAIVSSYPDSRTHLRRSVATSYFLLCRSFGWMFFSYR